MHPPKSMGTARKPLPPDPRDSAPTASVLSPATPKPPVEMGGGALGVLLKVGSSEIVQFHHTKKKETFESLFS